MANEKDLRFERSRQALVDAGRRMFPENRTAGLSDIARQAGVGRATLYRHFSSREQLVKAVTISCIEDFRIATAHIEHQAESSIEAIQMMLVALIPLEESMNFLMKLDVLMEQDQELESLFQQERQEVLLLMENCKAEGSIDKAISAEWAVALLDGLFFAAWQMVSEGKMSHLQVADLAFNSFRNGIGCKVGNETCIQ